ncbi:MAG TPA: ABC transporter ATP-binding protein [Solirubrobacteraceae bacterium]|jgi:iron(III) transport system ATP-binding protein|nr:ABC transporter ATP-binding protein [Solirubrobacteraceae bacterium]
MSGLAIDNLHKGFGEHPVLSGLNLQVPAGSFTAILGPSGSGKTTLLRLLAGFERPDRGSIAIGQRTVDGEGIHVHPERRRVGYVPQEGSLFPHLTVAANIGFGLPRKARRGRVGGLLELVGLADLGQRYPHQLSGGEQQRVALARALAVDPEIVLLDEPFASLDAHLRARVREEVQQILRRSQTTTLLVTHDQDEALSLADQVAVLRDGAIVQHAPPQHLYTTPIDGDLARFIGEANLIEGLFDGTLVETPLGKLPAHWHGDPAPTPCPVIVLIRPEQISVNPVDDSAQPAGRIARTRYHGHDMILDIQIQPEHQPSPLLARTLGDAQLVPGQRVTLGIRGSVLVWPDVHAVAQPDGTPVHRARSSPDSVRHRREPERAP